METVLKFIKEAETPNTSGEAKKKIVMDLIKTHLPEVYENPLTSVFIDTCVLISNNPAVIKRSKECCGELFNCLRCFKH
jgi:hypothetical protein